MKKILPVLMCIILLAGCSAQPETVLEPTVFTRDDYVGVYVTEYYTNEVGVDNPQYTKYLGEMDEDQFVRPGSEAVVELCEDGAVWYGDGVREFAKVGTWTYNNGEVTVDTPNITNDINESITITCMGMDMGIFYGYSGIPHIRKNYFMVKLQPEYLAGEYALKAGASNGEYYSVEEGSAAKDDVTLTLSENGKYKYKCGDTALSGTWKANGRFIELSDAENITAEYTNGRVFIANGDRTDMLLKK